MAPPTTVVDNFNRADDSVPAVATADSVVDAHGWFTSGNVTVRPSVVSNQLVATSPGWSQAVRDTIRSVPIYAAVDLVSVGTAQYFDEFALVIGIQKMSTGAHDYDQDYTGYVFRYAPMEDPDLGNAHYLIGYGGNYGDGKALTNWVEGSMAQGAGRFALTVTVHPTDATKIRITGWFNGVEVAHLDDTIVNISTAIPTGGAEGLTGYSGGFNGIRIFSTEFVLDNWGDGTLTPFASGGQINAVAAVSATIKRLRRIVPATINATAAFSGAVSKAASTKAITPATINASAAVSGAVSAKKLIKPASIGATATVTGAVAAQRRVSPATISAPAAVSASVKALRRVAPANVSATSVVSGAVKILRAITPATINAPSTMSATAKVLRRIAPTQINATSSVSATVVTAGHKLVTGGNIAATATVSGSIRALRGVKPAQISATSVFSSSLIRMRRALLPSQISAYSAITGQTAVRRGILPATVFATSTLAGAITVARPIAQGQVLALSSVFATLTARRRIGGAVINATSLISGFVPTVVPVTVLGSTAGTILTGSRGAVARSQ